MPAQIRPNRLSINDRFPMLGFTIHTDGIPRRAEVTIATDPDLFTDRNKRTAVNFYSTNQLGPLSIPSDEAVYVVPPEILARFIGHQRLYFALATAPAENEADYSVDVMPDKDSPYISIGDLTGRSLRRVRLFPDRNHNKSNSYGTDQIAGSTWAGDQIEPGLMPASNNGNMPNSAQEEPSQVTPPPPTTTPVEYDDGFGPMPSLPEDDSEMTLTNSEADLTIPSAQAMDFNSMTISPDQQAITTPAIETASQIKSTAIQIALATNPTLTPMVVAARVAAETGLVSVGIGPQVSAGLLGGGAFGVGLIFAKGNTMGLYGSAEVDAGLIASIGATIQLTILRGGIESFRGISYVAGISGGEGLTAGAVAVFDANRNFLGVSLQVGVGISLSLVEIFTGVQRSVAQQLGFTQTLENDPEERSYIVSDTARGMSFERRNFGHAVADLSGETTLSVTVPNMPEGGSLMWRIADGVSRDRIAIIDSHGVLKTSATTNSIRLRSLQSGVADIAAIVYDADGNRIESEIYAVSSPRFIWIGQDDKVMSHLTNNLNMTSTEVANMFSDARDALRQRYSDINVRFVWADQGMTLPAHLQLASDSDFPVTVRPDSDVVIGRLVADPATLHQGSRFDPGDLGQSYVPAGVIPPGILPPFSEGNELDNYEIAQINMHVFLTPPAPPATMFGWDILSEVDEGFRSATLSGQPRADALLFYGRLVGSIFAHELGHVLLHQNHLPLAIGQIMLKGAHQSVEELTGVQVLPGSGGVSDTFVVLPAANMTGFSPSAITTLTDRSHWPAQPPLVARSFTLDTQLASSQSFNESFTINWDEVQSIAQPTNDTCWATAGAMVIGWRDRMSLTPETIAEISGRTTATGLNPSQVGQFAQDLGLIAEAPQSYTMQAFRDLVEDYGPLWVGASIPSLHVIVVTGLYNEGQQLYVRITDPLDRAVGSPGSPGPYTHTHHTGSRYIMTWEDFVREYEDAAINFSSVNLQILHAADVGGRQPNRGSATPPGYALSEDVNNEMGKPVPVPMPAPATPPKNESIVPVPPPAASDQGFGPGVTVNRQASERNGVSYDLAQLSGMVAPDISREIALPSPLPGNQIVLNDWPYIDSPAGRSKGGVTINWNYAAGTIGNVSIQPADAAALGGWQISVTANITRHQAVVPGNVENVAKLEISIRTVFAKNGENDQVATSHVLLSGDGQSETNHSQELPSSSVAAE